MQEYSTTDLEDRAPEGENMDRDSIGVAAVAHLFSDHMAACGSRFQGGSGAHNMFPQAGSFQTVNVQRMDPQYSNVTKTYNNWNMCYSCGFDVKDGHTFLTCPAH
jgi:hypothetical protein